MKKVGRSNEFAEHRPEELDWWWKPPLLRHRRRKGLQSHPALRCRIPDPRVQTRCLLGPEAEDILSSYFLAAALGDLPITQVYVWVTEQVSQKPIEILKEHDYELQYEGLGSRLKLAYKQRDGIFCT